MSKQTILIADDEEMLVEPLRYQLEQQGYQVLIAHDGESALSLALQEKPDMLLLDVMMPKRLGWDVCQRVRAQSNVPIIMLSAKGEEIDRVMGLELGADDYVVKPFSFRELHARIHANLRRVSYDLADNVHRQQEQITLGNIVIRLKQRTIKRDGVDVILSQKEFEILKTLAQMIGRAVPRQTLLDQVWGEDWIGDTRTIDVHIRWLREKLEEEPSKPRLLLTARGFGYRLVTPDELSTVTSNYRK